MVISVKILFAVNKDLRLQRLLLDWWMLPPPWPCRLLSSTFLNGTCKRLFCSDHLVPETFIRDSRLGMLCSSAIVSLHGIICSNDVLRVVAVRACHPAGL